MSSQRPDLESLSPRERRELLAKLLEKRLGKRHLSFAQERLWLLQQLAPGTSVYNVPAAVELDGDLDVEALSASLAEIVRRHDVLRTTFELGPHGPLPRLHEEIELELVREDVSSSDAGESRRRALERANELAREPFDIGGGPLLRAHLVRFGGRRHLLLVVLHHLVTEVWSLAVLFEELEALYGAALSGDPPPLEPLPMQYGDYARWEREHFRGEVLERELSYWRGQLSGELPVLELPADRPRPAVQTFAGGWAQRRLSPSLVEALERLSRSHGATLFPTLLAGFQALLARYTGQTDILVGSPVTARSRPEAERLIGLFLNTLVLRTDVGGDPSFGELLDRVKTVAMGALAHQEVPFEQVVEQLAPDRLLSHTPIFQVMFALQNTPRPELDLAGVEGGRFLGPDEIHNGGTKVDLALFVESDGETLVAGCEYAVDLFERATVERLLEHFEVLLEAAVADPDVRISRLPLMGAAERHRVLVEWNRSATEYSADLPVHVLFERHAADRPDDTAVVDGDVTLSYAELDSRANRLARFLRGHGIGRGIGVGSLTGPSVEAVLALLAITKAGGVYVPFDPEQPDERLSFLLADSGVRVLLTRESRLSEVPETAIPTFCLDGDESPWMADEATPPPDRPVELEDLAYVIYTSGSTGQPKGVEIPHRGLANLAGWHRDRYALSQGDRATQIASLAFDASVWEIWPILSAGGTLHVVDRETRLSPDAVIEFLARHRITVSFVPTSMAEAMLERDWPTDLALRHLLTGGSQLHRHPPSALPFELVNHYGPTEDSVVTTAATVGADPTEEPPPIGRPIGGHAVYVLDRHGEPTPIGVPGEIHIGGIGLANGYRQRPGLTAERFVPSPFGSSAGARLYRTGDKGRWRADGSIDYLGRNDFQVQVRGFRVELEEIEGALLAHPEVHEAAVTYDTDGPRAGVLTGWIVGASGRAPAKEDVKAFLRRRLPEYMVPGSLVSLPALPYTPSGKIDRRALPALRHEEATPTSPTGRPLRPLEETILSIWREVLPTSEIGLDDSFFELGGHSLMLVDVHTRLKSRLDAELSIVDLFRYPTISSLVAHCERSTAATEQ